MIAKIIDDKTIHVFDKSQFDLYAIRNCGQIFRDPPCTISEHADKIVITATGERNSEWLFDYFDLGTDYNDIKTELMQFEILQKPINAGGGIRILRQPFVETLICFIISANNNIKRFTKTIEQIDFNDLGKYSEQDFKDMGCGYRAPYLVKTIEMLTTPSASRPPLQVGENFVELGKLNNFELRKRLMAFPGVGPKVADCIMLFAFHRLDIVPVDTWIKKAEEKIPSHRYAGVAQQYVFYYLQHLRKAL